MKDKTENELTQILLIYRLKKADKQNKAERTLL